MKFKSGYLNTAPILQFANNYRIIPGGKNPGMLLYTKEVINLLTKNIPLTSGWYSWGYFDFKNKWQTLYVGKAYNTGRIASLKYRITDELKEERACFWATAVGDKKVFLDHRHAFNGKYDKYVKRALRKKGTDFIIWVATDESSHEEIKNIEKGLIDYFKPLVNIQKSKKFIKTPSLNKAINQFEKEQKVIVAAL